MVENLPARIAELKREKGAVILAHYYCLPEVQAVADFLGDSLALSIKAQSVEEKVILFAGVNFMAETAKVLCPEKTVLIPCPEAGCSLADSCEAEELAAFKREHPECMVVSYVNTTVGVKALTDICCTSSNALQVVKSIPESQPILFAPDRNLGSFIQAQTGRKNMIMWDGCCKVHEEFSAEAIKRLMAENPTAKVVVHPECTSEVVALADYAGSTAGILEYCRASEAELFIVVTESGILAELEKQMPSKQFIPAPTFDPTVKCNECKDMKLVTLEKIAECLEKMSPEVEIDEEIRSQAEKAIINMVNIK
ncbi:MAG: quinolinate synthase NadA [Rikenellaceae bacterium]|nr:quinolinate synthase NadA [Rikenellaceae bacterium]